MTKGRPKDPVAAKRGAGHRKPKPALAIPTATVPDLPAMPEDLPEEMRGAWMTVLADMRTRPAGSATAFRPVDLIQVRCLVEAIWLHEDSSRKVRQYGTLVAGLNGPMRNPAISAQKDAVAEIIRLTDLLGLNPGARVRLGVMELAGLSILQSLNSQLDG